MEKIRCAAFMKATPYRARKKLLLTWRAAPPKLRFFTKTRSKMTFSQFYAGFHPPVSPEAGLPARCWVVHPHWRAYHRWGGEKGRLLVGEVCWS